MNILSSLPFSLGGNTILKGLISTSNILSLREKQEDKLEFVLSNSAKELTAIPARRTSGRHNHLAHAEMDASAQSRTIHTMDESTADDRVALDADTSDRPIASAIPSKKKVRKKNKRKKNKAYQIEEQHNVIAAVTSDSATDSGASLQRENSAFFVINLPNGRKLRLFQADPNLCGYQESIASLTNRKAILQELCDGPAEELINQQKKCRTLIAELKEEIKLLLMPNPNVSESSTPQFLAKCTRGCAFTDIPSSMSESFNYLAIDDLRNESKSNAISDDANSMHIEFESFNRMIPAVENRKTYRHFLSRLRDNLCCIEENYNRAISKARDETKKKEIIINFLELRSKLGFKETDAVNIVSVQHSLPMDASHVLFNPLYISRKLSLFFAVILSPVQVPDRMVTKQIQISVVGLNCDVKKCIDYLKIMDLSGKTKLPLCPNKIAALIGPGGSVIRRVESNYFTSIIVGVDEIILYGSAENMEKVKKHLEMVTFKQVKERLIYKGIDVPILTYLALSRFRSVEVQSIGERTDTIVQLLRKEDAGRVTIRGKKPEEVFDAKKQIQALLGSVSFFPLSAKPLSAKVFLNRLEISSLRSGKDFIVIEQNDHELFLIGSKVAVSAALPAIQNTLQQLSNEPICLHLHRIQANQIKQNKSEEIGKLDVLVLFSQIDDDHCSMELYGQKSAVEQAQKIANDFIAACAAMESISLSAELSIIVRKDRSILRRIETLNGILLSTTRKEIILIGTPEGVRAAKTSIEQWLSEETVITESLPIEKNQIPILIGREGVSIRSIKAESLIQNISIDDTKLVVKLKGTKEAVERARKLIEKLLSRGDTISSISSVNIKKVNKERKITPVVQSISSPTDIDIYNEKVFPSLIESLSR
ncbi:FUSE-binding protein 2 / KH-type splicing regulatory protein [Cardiosporidium cionae]|uniref:FUSE-binding protein 2 / KH-type splicing regulatory protein n=1 Tax=Cardiosporidium cionae TaxID=476202 RepID=A0ABQ7JCA0_9APIC|nr:FUSE-binding protein 2 / KH-type splicing regulatory protein [Cardiosporidium cionae]|eukprot:KAF8821632.1 FUSE-binding protein 2 / KH-type splicing regulatory protein [Cardiosporidium cionae]